MDLSVVQEDMQKLKESKKMKTEKNNTIFASLVEESSSMHSKGAGVWILQKKKKKDNKGIYNSILLYQNKNSRILIKIPKSYIPIGASPETTSTIIFAIGSLHENSLFTQTLLPYAKGK